MSLQSIFLKPFVVRSAIIDLIRQTRLGSYPFRLAIGAVPRAPYGYVLYHASVLATRLKIERISVLEFGVAGGRGLMSLEHHAREIERVLPIRIDIYGFDTGRGLPPPRDYRDLPYHWKEGSFRMDVDALRARLERAKLILGDIAETGPRFLREYKPAPIAAVIHDFDFYSSTAVALKIFDESPQYFLPRIYCYFDDTTGTESELYNDYTGERLAINEFNQTHAQKKLALPYHLLNRRIAQRWYHQIFIYHDFAHPQYNTFVSEEPQQIPL